MVVKEINFGDQQEEGTRKIHKPGRKLLHVQKPIIKIVSHTGIDSMST